MSCEDKIDINVGGRDLSVEFEYERTETTDTCDVCGKQKDDVYVPDYLGDYNIVDLETNEKLDITDFDEEEREEIEDACADSIQKRCGDCLDKI
jgi:hypothetical protein